MPTSGSVIGVPGDSFDQFNFTDLPFANLDAAHLAQFDTVVLVQVDSQTLTIDQQTALANFVASGCKLIIHDAEGTNGNAYDWLPGGDFSKSVKCAFCGGDQIGQGGTVAIENNSLISANPADPSFINPDELARETDAVGDANQLAAGPPWFFDAYVQNGMNFGPVHAYAQVSGGLMIYNGYDTDFIGTPQSSGVDWLGKMWYQELAQGWNPDNLPRENPQSVNTFAPPQQGAGGSPSTTPQPPCANVPVNCFDGEFWHTFKDLSVSGRGLPLDFTRTYSTLLASDGTKGPLGPGWTDSYNMSLTTDAAGDATVTEESGSSVTFTPASGGGYTAPSFVTASLVKNADGTFTFSRKNQTHYIFSTSGQLIRETDRNGYATTLSYAGGQLSAVTDPAGRRLTFSYNPDGKLIKVEDPIGRSVSFSYDVPGNLQTATDVGGGQTQFTYDSQHRMVTMTDPNGGVLRNTYDSVGRVAQQADPLGRTTKFDYQPGVQTTITDPTGNVTVEKFRNNLLVSRTVGAGTPDQATWSYEYDPATLGVTQQTDPNGHVTTHTYDARGNLLTTVDPLGRKTAYTYDDLNDITSVTDPLGVTTTKTYDSHGNLLTTSTPLTGTSQVATETYTYGDPAHPGDITSSTDAGGQVATFTYNQFGDMARSTDPAGDTTTFSYDGIGRQIAKVTPRGNVPGAKPAQFRTATTYNAFGQPLTVTDPLGRTTTYTYDANGNKTSMTDGNNNTTRYRYDADNELVTTIRPVGSRQHTAYDAAGNPVAQTDGLGHTTSYRYDALNRKISETDALGRTTTYRYDPAGNLISMTDPMGRTTAYGYDAANERTSITYSDGTTPNVTFSYDADGQRIAMTDGTGRTSYTYDSLHRMTSSTNGAGAVVQYTYPLRDLLTGITYPGGTNTVTRGFDAAGRLTSVTDWLGHTTRFSYDADGNLVKMAYPNGTATHITYNHADEIIRISAVRGDDEFLDLRYGRDRAGQVTAEDSGRFTYDPANRLTSASDISYTYDAADRLSSLATEPDDTQANTYDAADELVQQALGHDGSARDSSPPRVTYGYDANGNRTSAAATVAGRPPLPTSRYLYDQANRLVAFTGAHGRTTTYTYDGDGLRQNKATGSVTHAFVWNVAQGLPFLIQDGATSYVAGPGGQPLEQISPAGRVLFFHKDQLGSTRALTDVHGRVVATYSYDGYGNRVDSFGDSVASTARADERIFNPFQYAGEYRDPESGLYYLRARYYDPRTAQFISVDPLRGQTRQRYSYVVDNPVNHSDATGLITAGYCGSGSFSLGVFSGFGQGCVQTATKDPVVSWNTLYLANCLTGGLLPTTVLSCVQYAKSVTQIGATWTGGGGVQLLTGGSAPSGALLGQLQFSNGTSIGNLSKWFCYVSGGGGYRGVAAGVSVFSGACPPPTDLRAGFQNPFSPGVTNGFDIGLGIGTPEPSLTAGSSYTWCLQHNITGSPLAIIP